MKFSRIAVLVLVLGMIFTTGCLSIFNKEYTISGVIVDLDNKPIEGIEVMITGGTSSTIETDAEGLFLTKVKGNVTVTPSHEHYAFEPEILQVTKESKDLQFIGTYLGPYTISGTVLDVDSNPIPEAKVIITGQINKDIEVDAEGKWTTEVRGEVNLTSSADDYSFNTVKVTEANASVKIVGQYILVAKYLFEGSEDNVIVDSSKNNNDATLVGSFATAEAPTGTAMTFNGSSYVQMPHGIISECDEVTIATWVKNDEDRYWARVFSFGNIADSEIDGVMFLASQGSNFDEDIHDGQLKLDFAAYAVPDSAIFLMGPKLELETWYHVAVTITADTASLYVNGELYSEAPNVALPSDLGFTEENYIGKSNNRWPDPILLGAIADFRIYSEALSPEHIANLANQ